MNLLTATGVFLLGALSVGQNAPPASEKPLPHAVVISTDDVLQMLKAGLTPEIVAAKVRASKCQCDTSPPMLKHLKTAGVPEGVIIAMIESSTAVASTVPTVIDLPKIKAVYLVNRATDQKVFDHLSKKLREWGRWKVVERPEDADVLLVFAEKGNYLGSFSTATAVGTSTYASGSGSSVAILSDQRFLIAVEQQTERQLVVISCERRMGSGYTAGVLVNRMRKYVEKLEKTPP